MPIGAMQPMHTCLTPKGHHDISASSHRQLPSAGGAPCWQQLLPHLLSNASSISSPNIGALRRSCSHCTKTPRGPPEVHTKGEFGGEHSLQFPTRDPGGGRKLSTTTGVTRVGSAQSAATEQSRRGSGLHCSAMQPLSLKPRSSRMRCRTALWSATALHLLHPPCGSGHSWPFGVPGSVPTAAGRPLALPHTDGTPPVCSALHITTPKPDSHTQPSQRSGMPRRVGEHPAAVLYLREPRRSRAPPAPPKSYSLRAAMLPAQRKQPPPLPSPRYAVSAARADFPSFSFCTPFKAPDHVGSMRAFQLCCAAPDAFANSHHAAQPRHSALSHGLWKRSATRAAMPSSTKEVLTTVQRGRFV